jgi:hypothetical protein
MGAMQAMLFHVSKYAVPALALSALVAFGNRCSAQSNSPDAVRGTLTFDKFQGIVVFHKAINGKRHDEGTKTRMCFLLVGTFELIGRDGKCIAAEEYGNVLTWGAPAVLVEANRFSASQALSFLKGDSACLLCRVNFCLNRVSDLLDEIEELLDALPQQEQDFYESMLLRFPQQQEFLRSILLRLRSRAKRDRQ